MNEREIATPTAVARPTGRGTRPPAEPAYRPPYRAAAIAGLAVWLLYALTLSRTTWFWDTSEYIAVAHILGIPHPPGNPLFVLLARAWELLLAPFGLSVAVRINLFSATMGALAHACWFLVAHRVLSFYSTDRTFRIVGAAAAVLVSATAFTVWNQSNVNEKVYTVTLFTIALLSWLAFRWRDNIGVGKDDNLILLMVFILALSVGNHLMAFLAAPALLLFILLVAPRTLLNWRLYAAAVPIVILGLSVHLFLPIRSGLDPIINEAAPTCENVGGAMVSVVTMGRAGCENLSAALSRQQYDKPSMLLNPVVYPQQLVPRDAGLLVSQYINYLQWFDWQWARSVNGVYSWFGGFRPLFTLVFVALGIFGAWTHWQRDRTSWWYVAVLFGVLAFGLVFYLNFRYGFSDPAATRNMTEVRERDYFFICSFSIWGVWSGIGIAALWQAFTEKFAAERRSRPHLLAAPVLALALIPLIFNFSWASRHNDYTARDWAYNMLNSVEPYGVLFTNGDNDTFPLWYAQEVEGVRRDVTVIVMSYLNTNWYARQIRDLTAPCPAGVSAADDRTRIICQREYDIAAGPALYRERILAADAAPADEPAEPGTRAPTRSILPLSDDEIMQIANTRPFYVEQPQVFTAGALETTIPAQSIMIPANIFLATILINALEDRPIYFAMTTAAYDELNLGEFLIRHGVALKVNNGRPEHDPSRGVFRLPPEIGSQLGPYIDAGRTEYLIDEVFMHRGGFPERWTRWVDPATDQIPVYYAYTHYALVSLYESIGDAERARAHMDRWEVFWTLAMMRYQQ